MLIVASPKLIPELFGLNERDTAADLMALESHAWSSILVIDAPSGKWMPAPSVPFTEVTYRPSFDA